MLITTGANRRLRREHNERMTAMWYGAALVFAKERPPLTKFLIPEDPRPKKARPWQEIKAKLMLALGPGKQPPTS